MNRPWLRAAALLGLTVALAAAPQDALAAGKAPSCKSARAFLASISLEDCDFPGSRADPETSARRAIDLVAQQLGMLQGSAELGYVETRRGLAGRQYVRFQQMLDGVPVYGATINAVQDRDGRIRGVYSGYKAGRKQDGVAKRALTREESERIARASMAQEAGAPLTAIIASSARQVWFRRADARLVPAWEFTIASDAGDFRTLVDSTTGAVLAQEDRTEHVVTGKGKAFRPNPIQTSGDTSLDDNSAASEVNANLITVDLPNLDEGTGLLKGRFVDVNNLRVAPTCPYNNDPNDPACPNYDPEAYPVANEPSRQYLYELPNKRVAQVTAYWAIDAIQRHFRNLGFSSNNTVPNGIRSYPTQVNTNWDGKDNSAYSPSGNYIGYGVGGIPDAEDADIIVHEFGHAIQHDQNDQWGCTTSGPTPNPDGGECEMRAMGEGFSDYLAAAFHLGDGNAAYQQSHSACVGEWDATAYSSTDPPCLRRVDGNKIYPTDLQKNICTPVCNKPQRHKDGEIWSRVLWDIRAAVGTYIANQIILEHHYALPKDTTMPQAALAMLAVDADLFGGAYEAALRAAFCARGILSGSADCIPLVHPKVVLPAVRDSYLRDASRNRNDGAGLLLRLRGVQGSETRVVLGFDIVIGCPGPAPGNAVCIDPDNVKSAVIELTVAASDERWGTYGRALDIHPLSADFVEGNGVAVGLGPPGPLNVPTQGTGAGATWNCPADQNIANYGLECPGGQWNGGAPLATPFSVGTAIAPAVIAKGMTGKILRWAVTSDLKAGVRNWAVKTSIDLPSGQVDFYSREGAAVEGNTKLGPRLVVTLLD